MVYVRLPEIVGTVGPRCSRGHYPANHRVLEYLSKPFGGFGLFGPFGLFVRSFEVHHNIRQSILTTIMKNSNLHMIMFPFEVSHDSLDSFAASAVPHS